MRHKVRSRTLGRLTGHRLAMLRNLATSLLEHKRIETTEMRAKEVSRFVESIIEDAKRAFKVKAEGNEDTAHKELVHKRNVLAKVYSRRDPDNAKRVARDRTVAVRLFDQYAKEFVEGAGGERKGGYTRITRLGNRKGDGAPVVLLELVGLS